jgi:5-methylcytosine-specific restriction endonuclease McrA
MSDCIHPENTVLVAYRKGCRCDRCRSGYAEAHRVYSRRYVERHAARRKASVRAWQDANQERHRRNRRASQAKRRAAVRGSTAEKAVAALIAAIYRACPPGYEVDHVLPLSRGGRHCPSNLQYLTREENMRKGARVGHVPPPGTVIDWRSVVGK